MQKEVVSKVEVKFFLMEARRYFMPQWTEEETMWECFIRRYLLFISRFPCLCLQANFMGFLVFSVENLHWQVTSVSTRCLFYWWNQTGFIQRVLVSEELTWGAAIGGGTSRHLSCEPCAGCIQQYCRAFSALTLRERSQTQHLSALGSRVGSCLLSFP